MEASVRGPGCQPSATSFRVCLGKAVGRGPWVVVAEAGLGQGCQGWRDRRDRSQGGTALDTPRTLSSGSRGVEALLLSWGRCPRAEGKLLRTEGLCPQGHSVGGAALTKSHLCVERPAAGAAPSLPRVARAASALLPRPAEPRLAAGQATGPLGCLLLPASSGPSHRQSRASWAPARSCSSASAACPGLCWVSGTLASLGSGGRRLQEHWPGQAVASGSSLPGARP